MLCDRRSVLFFIFRYAPIPNSATCSKTQRQSLCTFIQTCASIPLRKDSLVFCAPFSTEEYLRLFQPCGLHDALASYLFLLNPPPGSSQPPIPASSMYVLALCLSCFLSRSDRFVCGFKHHLGRLSRGRARSCFVVHHSGLGRKSPLASGSVFDLPVG